MGYLILSLIPVLGFASPRDCPKRIESKQIISKEISGWKTFTDPNDIHILNSVDFYSGSPEKMAQLAPDNADSGKDPIWTFAANDEIWQVCRYTNSKISLTKKLESGVKVCSVKYSKKISPQIDAIDCK